MLMYESDPVYSFLQVGDIQCQCSWDTNAYSVASTLHAEAGEGTFCCGKLKILLKFSAIPTHFIEKIYWINFN